VITAVIPTLNRRQCLARTVPALAAQVYEVLLVDDASDPPVQPSDFAGLPVRVVRNPVQRGPEFCRNLGSRLAGTEWLLHTDDDITFPWDYVASLVAAQRRSAADAVAGRLLFLRDEESQAAALERWQRVVPAPEFPRFPLETNWSTPFEGELPMLHLPNTALLRRSLALQILWDERQFAPPSCFRGETDFFLRARHAGANLVFSSAGVAYHLPPSLCSTGGCRNASAMAYRWSVLLNNHRFLSRHYAYLRSQGMVREPRWLFELHTLVNQILGPPVKWLRRRFR
jgi:GT2 family glycosyltransferase